MGLHSQRNQEKSESSPPIHSQSHNPCRACRDGAKLVLWKWHMFGLGFIGCILLNGRIGKKGFLRTV